MVGRWSPSLLCAVKAGVCKHLSPTVHLQSLDRIRAAAVLGTACGHELSFEGVDDHMAVISDHGQSYYKAVSMRIKCVHGRSFPSQKGGKAWSQMVNQ